MINFNLKCCNTPVLDCIMLGPFWHRQRYFIFKYVITNSNNRIKMNKLHNILIIITVLDNFNCFIYTVEICYKKIKWNKINLTKFNSFVKICLLPFLLFEFFFYFCEIISALSQQKMFSISGHFQLSFSEETNFQNPDV